LVILKLYALFEVDEIELKLLWRIAQGKLADEHMEQIGLA
jgi:hypothetical protein